MLVTEPAQIHDGNVVTLNNEYNFLNPNFEINSDDLFFFKISDLFENFEKSGTNKLDEFRPINTLPILEKVIENIAANQISKYIDDNKLLSDRQSGFRSSHSCESALNFVIDKWKQALDKKTRKNQ